MFNTLQVHGYWMYINACKILYVGLNILACIAILSPKYLLYGIQLDNKSKYENEVHIKFIKNIAHEKISFFL